ncbi:MAG: 3-phosphoshikimate 1-carboxyvinyltransferase [Candidatus Sericytochromatia bacterium]|nr:3-phosphoshikimate 1-carboxyvinyltransferase [Candidatus Sericytochromatia bacterium]
MSSALTLQPGGPLRGQLTVPGDKSISHRALIFGALAEGTSSFEGLSDGADVAATRHCLAALGVGFEDHSEGLRVQGVGLQGLKAPAEALDCANSGTTLRLLMGVLAAQSFASRLIGDVSLSRRPMGRVAEPLRQMGAEIGLTSERFAPVQLQPARLRPLDYVLPVASAQVKSALLLAGLCAGVPVSLSGALASRDHSERLLPDFGVQLLQRPDQIGLQPQPLQACALKIPGDFSSAAFWLAGALLLPGSELLLEGVSLNPTRTGLLRALQQMGASIEVQSQSQQSESWGSLRVRSGPLQGIQLDEAEIPFIIDELPLLMLLATQAEGETLVRGAAELRVKESDRLAVMADNLQRMGVQLELFEDGFAIRGPQPLQGAALLAHHDHRIAMTMVLAALSARGPSRLQGAEVMAVSYPGFLADLSRLQLSEEPLL